MRIRSNAALLDASQMYLSVALVLSLTRNFGTAATFLADLAPLDTVSI